MSQPRTWAGSSLLATHGRGFSPWGWPQMAGSELAVVALPAEIDLANAEAVSMLIAAAIAPGPRAVVADMTATTFCDSTGIRVLVLAHRQAAACGTELRLLLPCHHVLRVMRVLGVDAVLPIYHTLAEARAGHRAADAGSWGMA